MWDLFGAEAARQHQQQQAQVQREEAARVVRNAIAQLDAAPKAVADQEQIKLARQDLAKMLQRPMVEPSKAQHKAEDSLKQLDAIKQKIKADQQYAEAHNQIKSFKSLATPEDSGPVADAHRAIAKAEFSEAVD